MPVKHDLFLSHASADNDALQPLYDALVSVGLRVWLGRTHVPPFGGISRSVVDGLAGCKALLAFYSTTYPTRRACEWELTAAYVAADRLGDPCGRVLVVNPANGLGHIRPIGLRDALIPPWPAAGDEAGMRDLAGAIRAHVDRLEDRALGDSGPWATPRWYGKQPVDSARFVGRGEHLWKLHSMLHEADHPMQGERRTKMAAIVGLGGMGKSMLAEEYALRFASAYPGGIFWLRAYGADEAMAQLGPDAREAERDRQLREIAMLLQLNVKGRSATEVEGLIARAMEQRNEPCLWVVDDLPGNLTVDEVARWLARHPLASSLVTTRSHEYANVSATLPLGELSAEDAFELLTARRQPASKEEKAAAEAIVAELGRHALAVDVSGAALASIAGRTFASYLDGLRNPTRDELELAGQLTDVLPTGHASSIAATLRGSIDQLGPRGRKLLMLAALLPAGPIPERLLVGALLRSGRANDEHSAHLALRETDRLALTEAGHRGDRQVHALVARTVRRAPPPVETPGRWRGLVGKIFPRQTGGVPPAPRERARLHAALLSVLYDALEPAEDPRTHPHIADLVPHARGLTEHLASEKEARLAHRVAVFDDRRGAHSAAAAGWRRVHGYRSRTKGERASTTLASANCLAAALAQMGDFRGALSLGRRVLDLQRRTLGKSHPETLTSASNLANVLAAAGDLAAAHALSEETVEARRRVLGEAHPETLDGMSNLCSILAAMGSFAEARVRCGEVLEVRRRVLGDEHPDTLDSMSDLANLMHETESLSAARFLCAEVLEVRRRVLGEEHPHTLTSMSNLALMLADAGDYTAAQRLDEPALEIRRRVLGEEHPDTLDSMNNLASALAKTGDHGRARELREGVLETRRRVLGDDHPDTIGSECNLASSLDDAGDLPAACALSERVVRKSTRVLGEEHPLTLTCMSTYAAQLADMGELAAARLLAERTLAIQHRVLGDEHRDVLISTFNVAEFAWKDGDSNRALHMARRACDGFDHVLGADHPYTREARVLLDRLASNA